MFNIFKIVFKYNWKYKWSVILCLTFVIISAGLSSSLNIIYKYLIDGLDTISLKSAISLLAIYIIVEVSIDVVNMVSYYAVDSFTLPAGRNLRTGVFKKLHDLDISFHENKQSGKLISRIKRGDGAFFSMNHDFIFGIFRAFLRFLFFGITFTFIKIEFSLVIFVVILMDLFVTYFLIKYNLKARAKFNKEEDNITHIVVDNMINYDTVKYFAREEYEQSRLNSRYKIWMSAVWGYVASFRLIDIVTGILSISGSGILIYMAIIYHQKDLMTTGDVVMTISFVVSVFPEFRNIIHRLRSVIKNYVDLEKYISILNYKITVKELPNAKSLKVRQGSIKFENVKFSYLNRETIFPKFDLQIKSGESIAFVGESGAGKTTLTKLLLRFYDIQKGKILIDGQDITKVTKKSLRESIGVVPQEPILFNDTISYNLGYGIDNPSLKAIKEAAKFANLSTFIESLPKKYNTLVGERGIKLSGGQKQRLAIARMFLASPPIIIFDEATSQLDSKSEQLIQDAFWKLAKNRTTLIIAHRLSTVMRADRIIVLDNGQIVQQGTHTKLSQQNGVYKTLWDIQKGDFVL